MKLLLVAKVALVLWTIRDIVVSFPSGGLGGCIGYVLFDLRVWLLVIGIVLLSRRQATIVKPMSEKKPES